MNTFICYEKCSTCKKAQKFLTDNKIDFIKSKIQINENENINISDIIDIKIK